MTYNLFILSLDRLSGAASRGLALGIGVDSSSREAQNRYCAPKGTAAFSAAGGSSTVWPQQCRRHPRHRCCPSLITWIMRRRARGRSRGKEDSTAEHENGVGRKDIRSEEIGEEGEEEGRERKSNQKDQNYKNDGSRSIDVNQLSYMVC